jgi:hypothetical protein
MPLNYCEVVLSDRAMTASKRRFPLFRPTLPGASDAVASVDPRGSQQAFPYFANVLSIFRMISSAH